MSVIFLLVFFFVSLLIVGLVLLQEGKGGGLTGMSTGMDGVMGAKNPLRRMTAWLFVLFVLLAIGINWHFYANQREEGAIPEGLEINTERVLEETTPASGPLVLSPDFDPAAESGSEDLATPATETESLPIPTETESLPTPTETESLPIPTETDASSTPAEQ